VAAVLARVGLGRGDLLSTKWTIARIHQVLDVLATDADREREQFLEAIRNQFRAVIREFERCLEERQAEEKQLVTQLLRERANAAAGKLYADEALIQRVTRAESHLSAQLDKALMLLSARQADRRVDESSAAGLVIANDEAG
jgi:hypothetical protein